MYYLALSKKKNSETLNLMQSNFVSTQSEERIRREGWRGCLMMKQGRDRRHPTEKTQAGKLDNRAALKGRIGIQKSLKHNIIFKSLYNL